MREGQCLVFGILICLGKWVIFFGKIRKEGKKDELSLYLWIYLQSINARRRTCNKLSRAINTAFSFFYKTYHFDWKKYA